MSSTFTPHSLRLNPCSYISEVDLRHKIGSIFFFGAGTQSIGLLLMSLRGLLPIPDYTVFVDVGNEPLPVYQYLSWFIPYIKKKYGYTIHVIKPHTVSLGDSILNYVSNPSLPVPRSIPYFTSTGKFTSRQCTINYKIRPLNRFLKSKFNAGKYKKVECFFAISVDEIHRMRTSDLLYKYYRYPLIEYAYSRNDVINYVKSLGLPKPFWSSCVFCPFHSESRWRDLYLNDPQGFKYSLHFDSKIRNYPNTSRALFIYRKNGAPLPLSKFSLIDSPSLFPSTSDSCGIYCDV